MEALSKTIVAKTAEWVWQRGADHFTVDELAGALQLSKKTIYKHFESKQELVHQSIVLLLGQQQAQLALMGSLAENALQEVVWTGDYLVGLWQTVSPHFLQDLQRGYSRSFREYGHCAAPRK